MQGHDVVVIGASAGGVEAIGRLIRRLPADLPAAVFVVLHIAPHSPGMLPQILSRSAMLPVVSPNGREPIRAGRVYVARPDRHMILEPGYVLSTRGPRENRHRPAIDVLFRSAASAYGPRVVGVILSGTLDDGAAGLRDIKQRGGITLAQDPDEATYPDMPSNAIATGSVDHVLRIEAIVERVAALVRDRLEDSTVTEDEPNQLEAEIETAKFNPEGMEDALAHGRPSAFSCPECGGVLWQLDDQDILRYRCRVGHAYSAQSLAAEQGYALEEALWAALRALEENEALARNLAERARKGGSARLAARYEERADEVGQHASLLRSVLVNTRLGEPHRSEALNPEEAAHPPGAASRRRDR